jgi:hypothetical protein
MGDQLVAHSTFVGVEDDPVIALALLRLKRARLTIPCSTRGQAINILRGVQPAPPRKGPSGIKAASPFTAGRCRKCKMPIKWGDPCRTVGCLDTDEHIRCKASADVIV